MFYDHNKLVKYLLQNARNIAELFKERNNVWF